MTTNTLTIIAAALDMLAECGPASATPVPVPPAQPRDMTEVEAMDALGDGVEVTRSVTLRAPLPGSYLYRQSVSWLVEDRQAGLSAQAPTLRAAVEAMREMRWKRG